MSDKELARLEVLRDLDQRGLTPVAAAQLLGLERRQVFRLLKAYRAEGPAGLVSKRRGRLSNRRQPAELRATALAIIRERYWDFGPTLAAEKLSELHGIALGRETLRQWMMADGLWIDRKQRLKRVHLKLPRFGGRFRGWRTVGLFASPVRSKWASDTPERSAAGWDCRSLR